MPLPLAPILPIALRLGVVAATGLAASRWLRQRSFPGRTDQRAEDRQANASARVRRVIRFRGRSYELDAGLMARLRLREREE